MYNTHKHNIRVFVYCCDLFCMTLCAVGFPRKGTCVYCMYRNRNVGYVSVIKRITPV